MVRVIGITGLSGSGKTYLTEVIEKMYPNEIQTISQDMYYKGTTGNALDYNFDTLGAIEIRKLHSDISGLKANKTIQHPGYDFSTHKRTNYKLIYPKKIILLEGHLIFLDEEIRAMTDIMVYLKVERDLALIRRIKRDMKDRGRDLSEILMRYERDVYPINQQIESLKNKCGYVITSSDANTIRDMIGKLIGQINESG